MTPHSTKLGIFGWKCPECECSVNCNVSGSPGLKRCVECKLLFTTNIDKDEIMQSLQNIHEELYSLSHTMSLNGLKGKNAIKQSLELIAKTIKEGVVYE